jgi:thiosulfate/3-mercaptopyruvate sulfurtransferase
MKSYGHEKVSILDGGLAALKAAGFKTEKGAEKVATPQKYHIDTNKIDYSIMVSKNEVLNAVKDLEKNGKNSKYRIIDTRRIQEIIGESKLDNVARGGHIPHSTLLEWTNFSDSVKKMSYKDKESMQKIFDKLGYTKDQTIYAYCHVGAGRSSYLYTVLKELGYNDVKVYTGSWDEWGNDFNMPIRR